MKANELMIGDLITFKDSLETDKRPLPIKVVELHGYNNYILAAIDGDDTCDELELNDEIVPIPITQEILNNNAISLPQEDLDYSPCSVCADAMCRYKDINRKYCLPKRASTPKTYEWRFTIGCSEICTVIYNTWTKTFICHDFHLKYVHQLQHALRLCGIEKEIVL